MRLDLGIQVGGDRGNAILSEVVLNPTDNDVIGEVVVWDVGRGRVDGRLLDAADARRVARAIVSDDGVEHGGNGIGVALVLGITDELRCGPSVGVGHKGEWFGLGVSEDLNLTGGSVDDYTPVSERGTGGGEEGVRSAVGADVVGA